MIIRANHTAKIRILCDGRPVFETSLEKILKMFPDIMENLAVEQFSIEVSELG